jgi:hypothetical protein
MSVASRKSLALLFSGLILILAGLACNLGTASPLEGGAGAPAASEPTQAFEEPLYTQQPVQISSTPTMAMEPVLLPSPTAEPMIYVVPPMGPVPTQVAISPAIPESRRLTLEYPPTIRLGDTDTIRLTLEVDTLGNVIPTAILEGNTITGETIQIPNL